MSLSTRLIMIEGIPGSGKTTLAKRIGEYLRGRQIPSTTYEEGEMHPADMAWAACLTLWEYAEIIGSHRDIEELIQEHSEVHDDYVLVFYTKLGFRLRENELMRYLESKEVYGGRVAPSVFRNTHLDRWKAFGREQKERSDVAIFECAYLQNHVNELLLHHCSSRGEIIEHLGMLAQMVEELHPVLIYLEQPDVSETIERVAKERRAKDESEQGWIDGYIRYVENCPFAKNNRLTGYDGLLQAVEVRREIELDVISRLPLQTFVISTPEYDYDRAFEEIRAIVDECVVYQPV